jgi:hypothetical protein
MSSNGLGFEEFMRKLVNAPTSQKKKPTRKPRFPSGKKIAAPREGR